MCHRAVSYTHLDVYKRQLTKNTWTWSTAYVDYGCLFEDTFEAAYPQVIQKGTKISNILKTRQLKRIKYFKKYTYLY